MILRFSYSTLILSSESLMNKTLPPSKENRNNIQLQAIKLQAVKASTTLIAFPDSIPTKKDPAIFYLKNTQSGVSCYVYSWLFQ